MSKWKIYTDEEICDNFEPNRAWMKRSGNMCWGMGAGEKIPCIHCSAPAWQHGHKRTDARQEAYKDAYRNASAPIQE